jgi:hypothetical protein
LAKTDIHPAPVRVRLVTGETKGGEHRDRGTIALIALLFDAFSGARQFASA